MSLARQPAGTVRAAQMSGTLDLPVNGADGPMVQANVAFTRGTANRFIHANRLVRAALAENYT